MRRWAAHRDEQGQALVEFALVLPIILLLLFGMLQFALVLNARQTVAYAAQAAANAYAQTLMRAQGDARAIEAGAQIAPRFATAGSVRYSLVRGTDESSISADGTGVFGDLVVARATYRYPSPIRAGIGSFRFPDTIDLTAEAVARIEVPGPATAGSTASSTLAPPSPTPTPAAATPTGTPAATPTPAPRTAGCYYLNGMLALPSGMQLIAVDGAAASGHRYFAPGSFHSFTFMETVSAGWFRAAIVRTGSTYIPAPVTGTVGTVYDRGNAVVIGGRSIGVTARMTGTAPENCVQGRPPR